MYEHGSEDHVSVGMRKPSGEYERPIPRTRLFWTKPGKIEVCSCFKTSNAFTIIKKQENIGCHDFSDIEIHFKK